MYIQIDARDLNTKNTKESEVDNMKNPSNGEASQWVNETNAGNLTKKLAATSITNVKEGPRHIGKQ